MAEVLIETAGPGNLQGRPQAVPWKRGVPQVFGWCRLKTAIFCPSRFASNTTLMLVRFASNSGDPQVKLCSDMGLKEAGEFALELKKAERAKEVTADNQQRRQHHHDHHCHHRQDSHHHRHNCHDQTSLLEGQVAEQRAVSSRPGSRRSSSRLADKTNKWKTSNYTIFVNFVILKQNKQIKNTSYDFCNQMLFFIQTTPAWIID